MGGLDRKRKKEQVPIPAIRCVSQFLKEGVPDGPTDLRMDGRTYGQTYGLTDERTNPLIEMRGRI